MIEIGKDIWSKLIQELLSAIDSGHYSLTTNEIKEKLDSDPNGLFDFIRERVDFGPSWMTAFTPEIEHKIAQLLRNGDTYGEAIHKLDLKDGLTGIIACAVVIWAGYR